MLAIGMAISFVMPFIDLRRMEGGRCTACHEKFMIGVMGM